MRLGQVLALEIFPIETVSKMLGHKNLKTTQHYAKILDRNVSDDMKTLREKFTHERQGSSGTAVDQSKQ